MRNVVGILILIYLMSVNIYAQRLLIPMDMVQNDHLKAYGFAYYVLTCGVNVQWILNFRGGSFLTKDIEAFREKADYMGVTYEPVSDERVVEIYNIVKNSNMDIVLLEKAPRVAVYQPPDNDPWDDAVTMALEYAEIPYTKLWDEEVLKGELLKYDWLHLHHEDFTGQYGKFYGSFRFAPWYRERVARYEAMAKQFGFSKVSQLKLEVARRIRDYVAQGGFLFAMCSACDTLDIALASEGIDIVAPELDGDPYDANANSRLNFNKTLAFTNFKLIHSPYVYEFSDIDVDPRLFSEYGFRGDFELFEYAAKFDMTLSILTQNHVRKIKGFMGQTTAFNMHTLKNHVEVMGKINERMAKYIHGNFGKGKFTFLGGHDPEDFAHIVGEIPTDLSLHKHSPGYRLILNNILFPAARKKKRKT